MSNNSFAIQTNKQNQKNTGGVICLLILGGRRDEERMKNRGDVTVERKGKWRQRQV